LEQIQDDPSNPKNFDAQAAQASNYVGNWQISVFYDPNYDIDEDDVQSAGPVFDINDYAPDTGKAVMLESGGPTDLTYCEGNFDGDQDVDGGDAANFKANFGRSPFKNPCPPAGPNY
jgi:hypothetical protein